jgi:hypothetical protein
MQVVLKMKWASNTLTSNAIFIKGGSFKGFEALFVQSLSIRALIKTLGIFCFSLLLSLPAHSSATITDPELKKKLLTAVKQDYGFRDQFDAEVWLTDMSARLRRYISDEEIRLHLLANVHREAKASGLNPQLVLAVIHVESGFDRFALSYVGAQGYMQIMPFWKNEIGRPDDNLMSTLTNLRYGCTILKHYIDKEKGNLQRGLARYNGSLGRTKYPNKVFKFWDKYWQVN